MTYRQIGILAALGCLIPPSACRDAPSAPADITPRASLLAAASPTSLIGQVNSVVSSPPSVIVEDSRGNPSPGIVVTFKLVRGGGVLANTLVTSNEAGIASVGAWTLGKTPEPNTVIASMGSPDSVIFTATAVAGPPARIKKVGGDNQIAAANSSLTDSPEVQVADLYGNALRGVSVTFAIDSGGGSLTSPTAVTDSLGLAASGTWTLGPKGRQTIVATTAGLPATVFVAMAVDSIDACAPVTGLAAGVTIHWKLTSNSCASADGRSFTSLPVALPDSASAYLITLGSKDFDTELELRDARDSLIALNNDGASSGTNSVLKVLAAPGFYTIVARSHYPDGAGAYNISMASVSPDVKNCEEVFVTRGVTLTERTTLDDCNIDTFSRGDRYKIVMTAGSSITIGLEDRSYEGPSFEVADSAGIRLATGIQTGYYTDSLVFTAPADGVYVITVIGGPISDSDITDYILTIR